MFKPPGFSPAFGSLLAAATASFSLLACGSDKVGDLSVMVTTEDFVRVGIPAGSSLQEIQDGWDVSFEHYYVSLGGLHLELPGHGEVHEHEFYAVDLKQVPANGLELTLLQGLEAGRWDFSYETEFHGTQNLNLSDDAFEAMAAAESTYDISGTIESAAGVSCPPPALATIPASKTVVSTKDGVDCYENQSIQFSIQAEVPVVYGPCEIDGLPGVVVAEGQTTNAAITLHVDHLFFNGFVEGAESGIVRLAQWLADSDLNLDGVVEMSELEQITPADLSEFDDRYQLGGSPIVPIDNLLTYVRAQLMTQGHYEGEGECPINGVAHEHDHDHDHEDEHDH